MVKRTNGEKPETEKKGTKRKHRGKSRVHPVKYEQGREG